MIPRLIKERLELIEKLQDLLVCTLEGDSVGHARDLIASLKIEIAKEALKDGVIA